MKIAIPTPPDFSFVETVSAHGWRRLAPFVWDEHTQTLERAEALPTGVVLLQMSSTENGILVEVQGEAQEDGAAEVEIARRVRRMLQLDLTLEEFHAYCRTRPDLSPIAECRRGRMLRCPTLHEDALKVIATSNTTWAQTIAMTARLVEHFGAPLPQNPERHAFPTPQRIAAVPFEEFAAKARMGYRNQFVYDLSTEIASGRLDLEGWQEQNWTAAELRKRLLSLPGIGPYGAACLMLYLGKPEHVNADSWARMLLGKEMGRPVTDKEVHAFFEQHGEWRGLVYNFYPWKEP
jgi:3-methyladenine DNA glycosylase/8-oxoguanine DNA glycosylase